METKYLIIGNSIAGVSCIEGIRQSDIRGKITVVSDEKHYNYSRPLISYYLGGAIEEKDTGFRGRNFYRDNGVNLLLETRAEEILTAEKLVRTDKGSIGFEKLLIATGGSPIKPPIEGGESIDRGVFNFTGLDDAKNIIAYINKYSITEAVVLGAGLIGLKCAEGLIERGIKVTIVELADRLLANTFDKKASTFLEKALQEKGCRVLTQDTVTALHGDSGRISKVSLKSGKQVETGMFVIAVGVKPNIEILAGTSIARARGITVDKSMETNINGIYAAGDVAEGIDILSDSNSVIAIWPVAARQGKTGGINMAGGRKEYDGFFAMNSVELAGIPTISFGITNTGSDESFEVLQVSNESMYKKVILKDNRIVGAIFLGKVERSGIFSGLIRDRVDVSSFKQELLKDDFGLLVLPKEYRKHLVTGEGIEV